DEDETPLSPVDVTVRAHNKSAEEAVAIEARKGHDFLFIGLENTSKKGGGFHPDFVRIAAAFDGPLAVAIARRAHLKDPQACPMRILVPVNGSQGSRNAAEVA